jgi:hypothetical protein
MEASAAKPVSLRHALSLLWLAIVLHIGSSGLALLGLMGVDNRWRWLLVDGLAIIAILLAMRGLKAGNRWARWLLVPIALIITTLVFPRMLLSADALMLWVTMVQGVVQLGAAWFAFERDTAGWFAGE